MSAPLRRTPSDRIPAPAGAAAGAPHPPPLPPLAGVRYNDWPSVRLPDPATFAPARAVSVIVPTYRAPEPLALTLAGLERQDYPRTLLEVVVVDDGSDPPVEPPAGTSLDLRVVRQPRRGFGLARARNSGARAASHDILVFLDGDVIAEAGLIRAHARWHHAVGDALTQGFCAFVGAHGLRADTVRNHHRALATLFEGLDVDAPWIERHMARTGDLTSRHADLFRAVTGHNLAISRALFEEAGGFDESFDRYGGEDTELGYRVQARGGLLVPVRAAFAWHQGRWLDGRDAKRRHMALQADRLADRIPDPGFRPASPAARHAVPRHVVTVAGGPIEGIVRTAGALLAPPGGDLALLIDADRRRDRVRLARRYEDDPRVRVDARASSIEAFPAAPLHVRVPAGAVIGPDVLNRLEAALGDAVAARATLDRRGREITITRGWALHRARRAGGAAADYGDARSLPARALRPARPAGPGARSRTGPTVHPPGTAAAAMARVRAEARHVHDVRSAWRFVRWLLLGLRWRLRLGRGLSPSPAPRRPPGGRDGAAATPGRTREGTDGR